MGGRLAALWLSREEGGGSCFRRVWEGGMGAGAT